MNDEKRNAQRIALEAPIKITQIGGDAEILTNSYDFSDSGLFVKLDPVQFEQFPIDTEVKVQYQELNYEAPIVAGVVVRHTNDGMGIRLDTH